MTNPPKITEHIISGEPIKVWHPDKEGEGYCISYSHGGWMPGVYDSVESALMGVAACFENENDFVIRIQKPVNHITGMNRLITKADFESEAHQEPE